MNELCVDCLPDVLPGRRARVWLHIWCQRLLPKVISQQLD